MNDWHPITGRFVHAAAPPARPAIAVPGFARLEDYFGEWAYEPVRFAEAWHSIAHLNMAAHFAAGPPPRPLTLTEPRTVKGKNISVISITGTMMKAQSSFGGTSTVQARKDIRAAAADPEVSGILLVFDSPGGTVAGTESLANDIRAANLAKPTYALAQDLTASAAYWAASQAAFLYAEASSTLVGSIGTVLTVHDVSKAFENEGVKTFSYSTGPLKGAGTPGTVVNEDHSAYFQSTVNGLQASFDNSVRKGRGMTAAELAKVKTGGVWPASQALDLKLIDGIRSMDAVLNALAAAK